MGEKGREAKKDDVHYLHVVQEEPLVIRMDSRVDGSGHFVALNIAELRRRYPKKRFQLVPLKGKLETRTILQDPKLHASHAALRTSVGMPPPPDTPIIVSGPGFILTSWLAIEEPKCRKVEPKKPKPRYGGGQIGS